MMTEIEKYLLHFFIAKAYTEKLVLFETGASGTFLH